jgi:hypothetical protein
MESVYNAAEATGQFNGFNQGAGRLASASTVNRNFSNIGDKVGGVNGANAPVVLMSCWESYFLQAEAAAKGWLSGSATTLYENGIKASFAYHDLAATDATAVIAAYPLSGGADAMAGTIVFQKWVAMNGVQNFQNFLEEIDGYYSIQEKVVGGKFYGYVVCFTGVRDSEMEQLIRNNGGEISSSVTKKTNLLVTKESNSTSTKAQKARESGVEVISYEEAKERFYP